MYVGLFSRFVHVWGLETLTECAMVFHVLFCYTETTFCTRQSMHSMTVGIAFTDGRGIKGFVFEDDTIAIMWPIRVVCMWFVPCRAGSRLCLYLSPRWGKRDTLGAHLVIQLRLHRVIPCHNTLLRAYRCCATKAGSVSPSTVAKDHICPHIAREYLAVRIWFLLKIDAKFKGLAPCGYTRPCSTGHTLQ